MTKYGKYLGEEAVDIKTTPFAKYKIKDWSLYFFSSYGPIDGAHHKTWVLDQLARILNGAPITIHLAKWELLGYQEYRVTVGTCKAYENWIKQITEEDQSTYDAGTAPRILMKHQS